jgi:hypothetical protein
MLLASRSGSQLVGSYKELAFIFPGAFSKLIVTLFKCAALFRSWHSHSTVSHCSEWHIVTPINRVPRSEVHTRRIGRCQTSSAGTSVSYAR